MSYSIFNILSFDGGGLKGALSISILERLQEEFPDIIRTTNMIGGTSTGSLIALGLAYGLTPSEIKEFYSKENSKYIFDKSYSELIRPKYNNEHLKEVLLNIFPKNLRLKDLGKLVIIPTFYIGNESSVWKPIFYNNLYDSDTENARVVDVAMASCAAPSFLPTYNCHIDGGIIATDPSAACTIHAMSKELCKNKGNIKLLSIGTGYDYNSIKDDTTNWGAIDWVTNKNPDLPIISVTLEGSAQTSQIYSEKLLNENYHRINPRMNKSVAMDDYNSLDYLVDLGKNCDLKDSFKWIENNW